MCLRIHELILLTIILASCGSPKEYLYTLSSSPASDSPGTLPTNALASIVVGPVTLPEVVDRPQIVVRVRSLSMLRLSCIGRRIDVDDRARQEPEVVLELVLDLLRDLVSGIDRQLRTH